jgi:hypothetical protein
MIASEDVARQTAEADAASAFLVAGDRRLRSDPRSVLANFDAIRQGLRMKCGSSVPTRIPAIDSSDSNIWPAI